QCQGEHKETQANLVVKLKAEAERTASLQKEIDALKGSLESAKSRAVELEKQVLVVPVETDDEPLLQGREGVLEMLRGDHGVSLELTYAR
ncbi:unnamed protein product, partial [Sphacelaria rigidula]